MRRNSFYLGVVLLVSWVYAKPAVAFDNASFGTSENNQGQATKAVVIPNEQAPVDPLRAYVVGIVGVLKEQGLDGEARALMKAAARVMQGHAAPQWTKTEYAKPQSSEIRPIASWTGHFFGSEGEMRLRVTRSRDRIVGWSVEISEPKQPSVVRKSRELAGPPMAPRNGDHFLSLARLPGKHCVTPGQQATVSMQVARSDGETRRIEGRNYAFTPRSLDEIKGGTRVSRVPDRRSHEFRLR